MKKLFFLFLLHVMFATLAVCPALAAAANMRAKQPCYGTEFDVYRTADMPANWFKTYDGYYVTRRIDANWVYGRMTPNGMEFTDIIVGSVDPRTALELGGTAPVSTHGPVYIPPAPEDLWLKKKTPRHKTGLDKVKDPSYQAELKEIIKDLEVRGPIFTNLSMEALVSDLHNHVVSTFVKNHVSSTLRGLIQADRSESFSDLMGHFAEQRLSSGAANIFDEYSYLFSDPAKLLYFPGRANVYDYSYPYLTRRHFPTKVPLDFHIIHERETGHVEFYVTVGAKAGFSRKLPKDYYSSRVPRYLEEMTERMLQSMNRMEQYLPKDFRDTTLRKFFPDIVFYFEYDGDKEQEVRESDFYVLTPLPFEDEGFEPGVHRWQMPYSTYGLRLATTSRSTLLPMPTYESFMQKMSKAKRVRIFSSAGDATHYDRKATWKLLGIIELSAIDQKNRFVKSMEARYETYKKIVELEERWQGIPEGPDRTPHTGTWPLNRTFSADEIYDTLTDDDMSQLMFVFTELFGDPEITEHKDNLSNLVIAHVRWARGLVRMDFDYLFQGGRWNANQWDMLERPYLTEHWEDGQQAFATRVKEFTEMLGQPKLKQSSRAVWLIGDYEEAKFTVVQSENELMYWVGKKQSMANWKGTFVDPVK